jgi:hypothetical protein
MGTGVLSPAGNARPGRDADHSPTPSPNRGEGAVHPLPSNGFVGVVGQHYLWRGRGEAVYVKKLIDGTESWLLSNRRLACIYEIEAAMSSTPRISFIASLGRLPALHKMTKIDLPIHIHPEDGNCNVCRNVGQLPIVDACHTRKPKF